MNPCTRCGVSGIHACLGSIPEQLTDSERAELQAKLNLAIEQVKQLRNIPSIEEIRATVDPYLEDNYFEDSPMERDYEYRLLHDFLTEVSEKAEQIDPDEEYHWEGLTVGWAIAKGVPLDQVVSFAIRVRYNTSLA